MTHYLCEEIYTGKEKIALAMDIGTTHSAVSFAHLLDNKKPVVHMVTEWQGECGPSKIPTVVAYHGKQVKACGSAAVELGKEGEPVTEWFKLHLHPASMTPATPVGLPKFDIPKLPRGLKIEQIYADFMTYLMNCTKLFFEKRILPDGAATWQRLRKSISVILTIPNGWGPGEQEFLCKAAVQARLVTEKTKHDSLEFITEGEASVHWALAYHHSSTWLSENTLFAVVDAGGSTVDSTLYKCEAIEPKLILHEACTSELEGYLSIVLPKICLNASLGLSKFACKGNLDYMEAEFKGKVKHHFDGTQLSMGVRAGGSYEHDKSRSIKNGQLTLKQEEISAVFDSVIRRIKESCHKLVDNRNVKYLLLVGGFGESPYLHKMLDQEFKPAGVSVFVVGHASKKAAAEGALMWYLKQAVTTRVAKITLGMECTPEYDLKDDEHLKRRAHILTSADLVKRVPNGFCVLIQKGEVIDEDFLRIQPFHVVCESSMKDKCKYELFVWDGQDAPQWIMDRRGNLLPEMRLWGHLEIDMIQIRPFLDLQCRQGGDFYDIDFDVVIRPKGTQLQAVLRANYEDTLCEGHITLVPNALSGDPRQ